MKKRLLAIAAAGGLVPAIVVTLLVFLPSHPLWRSELAERMLHWPQWARLVRDPLTARLLASDFKWQRDFEAAINRNSSDDHTMYRAEFFLWREDFIPILLERPEYFRTLDASHRDVSGFFVANDTPRRPGSSAILNIRSRRLVIIDTGQNVWWIKSILPAVPVRYEKS